MVDVFRPFFRSVEDKVANRREQVRKAQRTFRERRDHYLKTLESRVRHLQTNEALLQNKVDRLEHELLMIGGRSPFSDDETGRLNQLPSPNSSSGKATWPTPSPGGADESITSTVVWVENRNNQPHQLHVQQVQRNTVYQPSNTQNGEKAFQPQGQLQPTDAVNQISIFSSGQAFVTQLDVVTIATEFILRLESPCLPHIQHPSDDPKVPHGHVHTASATLLCSAPPERTAASRNLSWSAPREILVRLLDISNDLPLEGWELTPVQVWHQIAQAPNFTTLKVEDLKALADRLLAQIKCYGFGAVVRQDYLKKLLSTSS